MASKITIKRSLTAAPPAGLSFGEMAFVQGSGLTANQLYVGISGGNPAWVGAQIGTTGTWTDNAAKTSLATQFAIEERIGAKISAQTAGVATFNGATGAVTGVASFNGLTGAVSGVGSIVAGTGISISGPTGAVTVNSTYVPALATTGVTGVASFNSADFAVSGAGDVTIKAAGVGNAQLENPNITINGTTIALGVTHNFKISDFGSVTSAELAGKLSDSTGTGFIVLATGPTLSAPIISSNTVKNSLGTVANIPTTGAMASLGAGDTFVLLANTQTLSNKTLSGVTLGTPLSGTLTNCTGLPVGTGISGLAANVATFLATPSSANLAAALTDETGSGASVFATSPTLVTPTLGVAAATSINKVTITTPATGSTITVADGKTLTASNTLTFTGTDASSVAFGTGGTVVYTSGLGANVATFLATPSSANLISAITNETGTGALVFGTSPTIATPIIASIQTGSGLYTVTLPLATDTLVGRATTDTLTNKTLTGATLTTPALGTPSSGTLTNCTFPTLNQNTTGSAATLTTSRNINGTTFNGSADITVTAAANTLTGATLASNVLASSLTSVGTLGSLSITGDLTVGGTFTVNGTVTTINSTTLTVDDKNIELGSVAVPTNDTAADGGISLLGTTTKTLKWINSGAFAWTSSENFDLVSTKAYYIAGASVLNATTLGSAIVTSSLTSVGTLTSLTVSGTLEAGLIDGGTF